MLFRSRFEGRISGFPCGTEVQWWISASTTSGVESTFPARAPVEPVIAFAGDAADVVRRDGMQSDAGWSRDVAGDTAPRGLWVRGIPRETSANPGYDASPDGRYCWFTGQSPVANNNTYEDVDAGRTTLLTPLLDLSLDPSSSFSVGPLSGLAVHNVMVRSISLKGCGISYAYPTRGRRLVPCGA